jgi:hypothetical protein
MRNDLYVYDQSCDNCRWMNEDVMSGEVSCHRGDSPAFGTIPVTKWCYLWEMEHNKRYQNQTRNREE